ncbi:hypothetical protein MUK42_27248 [Musa troglodytarum]|uniref:Uncharacterized protein n=1 Tax=Musa troglodytarum TaxID=320322 RepID=A0A9E7F2N7_9LILI|nr:hypothetical protein MUK42_27248 [Musa troglodytarum]
MQPVGAQLMRRGYTDVGAAHRRLLRQAEGAAALPLRVQEEPQLERLHQLR